MAPVADTPTAGPARRTLWSPHQGTFVRRAVLRSRNRLQPGRRVAAVGAAFEHGEVAHEDVGGGAMPVVFVGWADAGVTGAHTALARRGADDADALGDVQGVYLLFCPPLRRSSCQERSSIGRNGQRGKPGELTPASGVRGDLAAQRTLCPVGDHGRGPCGSRGRPPPPPLPGPSSGAARGPTRIHTLLPTRTRRPGPGFCPVTTPERATAGRASTASTPASNARS